MKKYLLTSLSFLMLGGCIGDEKTTVENNVSHVVDDTYDLEIKSVEMNAFSILEPNPVGIAPNRYYAWDDNYYVPISGSVRIRNNGKSNYQGRIEVRIDVNIYEVYPGGRSIDVYVDLIPNEEVVLVFGYNDRFQAISEAEYARDKQISFELFGDYNNLEYLKRFDYNSDNNSVAIPIVFVPNADG